MIFNIKTRLLNHVGGVVEALYRMNDEEITAARSNLPNNYLKILTKGIDIILATFTTISSTNYYNKIYSYSIFAQFLTKSLIFYYKIILEKYQAIFIY